MTTKLEQSIIDLCAKHDLSSVSFHFRSSARISPFGVYVFAPDLDGECELGGGKTLAEALSDAMSKVAVNRANRALADEPLPECA